MKQALPQLKVKQEWLADQRRAIVEADAMRLFHSLTPNSVPEIVDNDPDAVAVIADPTKFNLEKVFPIPKVIPSFCTPIPSSIQYLS